MKNFWLEGMLERETRSLPWDLKRVQILESLIRSTAHFGLELHDHCMHITVFEYDSLAKSHLNGTCDPSRVKEWVYLDLLKKSVQDANAVALLRSKSLSSQALNLWRTLFETEVVCRYVGEKSQDDDHLACRFAIHSVIRPTVGRWNKINKLSKQRGMPEYDATDDITHQKDMYKETIGKWGNYTWAGENYNFARIAEASNSDMLFYEIANNEVHPTFGESEVVTDLKLPLPTMPLLPIDIAHGAGEYLLEFQTAKSLSHTTSQAINFTKLTAQLQESLTTLEQLASNVLKDLA